jgi:hypothetical protein
MSHITEDRLNDYVDELLPDGARRAVEAHLATCATCRGEEAELRALLRAAVELPGVPPARDLWSGIAARIEESRVVDLAAARADREAAGQPTRRGRPGTASPRTALWTQRYPLAAAAILLVVASSLVTALLLGPAGGGAPMAGADAARAAPGDVVFASLGGAEGEYETAIHELSGVLDEYRHLLAPETIRIVEENLTIIDEALAAAADALADDPANPVLVRTLNRTYKQKVDVLQRAVRLAQI